MRQLDNEPHTLSDSRQIDRRIGFGILIARQKERQIDKQMHGQIQKQIDRQIDGEIKRKIDTYLRIYMHTQIHAYIAHLCIYKYTQVCTHSLHTYMGHGLCHFWPPIPHGNVWGQIPFSIIPFGVLLLACFNKGQPKLPRKTVQNAQPTGIHTHVPHTGAWRHPEPGLSLNVWNTAFAKPSDVKMS